MANYTSSESRIFRESTNVASTETYSSELTSSDKHSRYVASHTESAGKPATYTGSNDWLVWTVVGHS